MNSIETTAKDYAIKHHWGQMYGNVPYYEHLDDVSLLLKSCNYSSEMVAYGYLHDILEDCDVSFEDLSREFSPCIASTVYALTRYKEVPIQQYYDKLQSNHKAFIVKLADRISNIQACCKYIARTDDEVDEKLKKKLLGKLKAYIAGSDRFTKRFHEAMQREHILWAYYFKVRDLGASLI